LLDALLEGFAWDCRGRRYDDFSSLLDYAARVAGTVGVMMALLMGQRDPAALARAADLGVAMQLTNIARDVGEDARAGRVYVPLVWLQQAQLDANELLSAPAHSEALAAVVQRLLAEADALYRRADAGIGCLPPGCRPCIFAARLLYAEIGHELVRRDCDAVSQRAVVSAGRKSRVLARLGGVLRLDSSSLESPPLTEIQFLLDAVKHGPVPRPDLRPQVGQSEGVAWVLALFAELERREHAGVRAASARPRRIPVSRPTRNLSRTVARGAAS
jgi:phytoene synthase